jgi:predicted O-methyltransferase YrrM
MTSKVATAIWFAQRPSFWAHAMALTHRKVLPNYDKARLRMAATKWAASRAVTATEALSAVQLIGLPPQIDAEILAEAGALAERANVRMGGAGDLELVHAAVSLSGATRVIETGVAYGWSSLAILAALRGHESARLISVDMPYPKLNNEAFVGIVIPSQFRGNWRLIREPDRHGLEKAISFFGGTIDLCHYDSDKSWWGRQYAYPLLWKALRPGGIFISDDIQDNMAFADFVTAKGVPFAVTESQNKFVGIALKQD